MAALAATGALIVGGSAVAMVGSGNADPLVPLPVPVVGTTYVLPDLAPFGLTTATREGRDGGGLRRVRAARPAVATPRLRLQTPASTRTRPRSSIAEDAGSPLADWIPTAAYSAYQDAADDDVQFPSLQLVVDFNGDGRRVGFSTLTYEPVYNDGRRQRHRT